MQDRVDPVLEPRALAHDVRPASDLAPQRVGLVVGQPARGQKAGGQQLGQHLGVDLVGLYLRLGDRPGLRRVRDDYARDVALEQPRDRVGVAGRLERDLVGGGEALGEEPELFRRRLDLSHRAHDPVLPDGDLGELAVDVEPDAPSHAALLFQMVDVGEQAGKRHLRIRALSATGRVAGAAKY